MCKAVSIIITRSNKGYYKLGVDSHDGLLKLYKKDDSELLDDKEPPKNTFARVEISPKDNNYFKSVKSNWQFVLDEKIRPDWFMPAHEETAWKCWADWKKEFYLLVNLKEARKIINPINIKHSNNVSKKELKLLKEWDSVRDSVRASVGDLVGASVWDSVWDSVRASVWGSVRASVRDSVRASVGDLVGDLVRASVWDSVWASVGDLVRAYIGSKFRIKKWKYTDKLKIKGYPFQSVVKLWKKGLVPSYDGKNWRIHLMCDKAKIIWQGKI